jgi:hypothetical protein
MDENRIVVLLNGDNNVLKVTVREYMLHPCYILDNVFFNKRFLNPLFAVSICRKSYGQIHEPYKCPEYPSY